MISLKVYNPKWCKEGIALKHWLGSLEGTDFLYLDSDENWDATLADSIKAFPTAIIYRNKEEIRRLVGFNNHNQEILKLYLQEEGYDG